MTNMQRIVNNNQLLTLIFEEDFIMTLSRTIV